jgi:hypothetical protein
MTRDALAREVAKLLGGGSIDTRQSGDMTLRVRGGAIGLYYRSDEGPPATHVVATYTSIDDFRFEVQPKNAVSRLVSAIAQRLRFGERENEMTIDVGDPEFDAQFMVTTNSTVKARKLFADESIRKILLKLAARRSFTIEVRGAPPESLTSIMGSTHEIVLEWVHTETDVFVLVAFFQLFTKLLEGLCELGSARG